MKIKKYIQGENDQELFGILGFWLTNQEVHKELGTAITSKRDDIWYIQTVGDKAISFALVRKTSSTNALHLRFIYGLYQDKLMERILKDSKIDNLSMVWTNARDTDKIWSKFGFVNKRSTSNTGKFVRFEKELKDD